VAVDTEHCHHFATIRCILLRMKSWRLHLPGRPLMNCIAHLPSPIPCKQVLAEKAKKRQKSGGCVAPGHDCSFAPELH
jgi:hypothetical protein